MSQEENKKEPKEKFKIDIENYLIILSTATLKQFLKYQNASDLIALYTFYYYTAKWQNTNRIKATITYCRKCLHWSQYRFSRANKTLIDLNLIQKIPIKNSKGQIQGWYTQINFIWSKNKVDSILSKNPEVLTRISGQKPEVLNPEILKPEGGFQETNALSDNNINALNNNIINALNATRYIQKQSNQEEVGKRKSSNPANSALKDIDNIQYNIQDKVENQTSSNDSANSSKSGIDDINNNNNINININLAEKQINDLIPLFAAVNPAWRSFYANKTQRRALKEVIGFCGFEKTKLLILGLKEIQNDKYAPVITTPLQLYQKFGNLRVYIQRKKQEERKKKQEENEYYNQGFANLKDF